MKELINNIFNCNDDKAPQAAVAGAVAETVAGAAAGTGAATGTVTGAGPTNDGKRTPKETEQFTAQFAPGYADGNEETFIRTEKDGKAVIEPSSRSTSGAQMPDKYKFSSDSGTLYIIEDKNYSIHKDSGSNNLLKNIVDQAEKRIRNCLDADVPVGVMGNTEAGHIDDMVITFAVDAKGHYVHDDGTPVRVEEHAGFQQKAVEKLRDRFEDTNVLKNVRLRIVTVFDNVPNRPLDVSGYK